MADREKWVLVKVKDDQQPSPLGGLAVFNMLIITYWLLFLFTEPMSGWEMLFVLGVAVTTFIATICAWMPCTAISALIILYWIFI